MGTFEEVMTLIPIPSSPSPLYPKVKRDPFDKIHFENSHPRAADDVDTPPNPIETITATFDTPSAAGGSNCRQ
jgi:hypothetical protein